VARPPSVFTLCSRAVHDLITGGALRRGDTAVVSLAPDRSRTRAPDRTPDRAQRARADQRELHPSIVVGPLEIRPGEGLVKIEGRALSLSVREFELLVALARRRGRIVPRAELFETVWGHPLRAADRSVDVYVSKLRTKLERALAGTNFIHTHFGFGYRFEPEPSQPFHKTESTR
jgi:DNA-binding response OmpR family regulator